MFTNVQPTQFDLNFRILGIPVRVHPSFWIVAALICWPFMGRQGRFDFLLVGMACVFLSLMAHELGHALMFGAYGVQSGILLYMVGGLTIPNGGVGGSNRRIIVSLAGPIANFLIAFVVWATDRVTPWAYSSGYSVIIYFVLFDITLYWGLLNLIPVLPLDGGQISRELWLLSQPRQGLVNSLRMSIVVAAAVSLYSFGCEFDVIPEDLTNPWLRPGSYVGVLFAILAVQNYADLQNMQRSQTRYYDDDRPPWR